MKNELLNFLVKDIKSQIAEFDSSELDSREIYNDLELPELPDEIFYIAIVEAYKESLDSNEKFTHKDTSDKLVIESITFSYLENLYDKLAKIELSL